MKNKMEAAAIHIVNAVIQVIAEVAKWAIYLWFKNAKSDSDINEEAEKGTKEKEKEFQAKKDQEEERYRRREQELHNKYERNSEEMRAREKQLRKEHEQQLQNLKRQYDQEIAELNKRAEESRKQMDEALQREIGGKQTKNAAGPPAFAMLSRDLVISATNSFHNDNRIGQPGTFSSVYRASLAPNTLRTSDVAIKTFSIPSDLTDKKKERLTNDLLKMIQLEEHVNVLPLLGLSSFPTCAIYPWMVNGSLQKYMNDEQVLAGMDWKLRVSSPHFSLILSSPSSRSTPLVNRSASNCYGYFWWACSSPQVGNLPW